MKFPWFSRNGFLFLPCSWPGWFVLLATITIAVERFLDIDRLSHSASDTLMNWAFYLLLLWIAYSAVGFFTSQRHDPSR